MPCCSALVRVTGSLSAGGPDDPSDDTKSTESRNPERNLGIVSPCYTACLSNLGGSVSCQNLFGGGGECRLYDFISSYPPPLTQQVSECPYCSRMAAATQTYECVLVWKYCRQPLAIKLGRSRALYFTCLFGAVTPTSAFQDLATIYLFLPIEGNIQGFFFKVFFSWG